MAATKTEELAPEVIQQYKKDLERELKELKDWLDNHPQSVNIEGYELEQIAEVVGRHKKERADKEARQQDVEGALTRIENGTFGICPDCETTISKDRLDLNNHTYKRCRDCQTEYLIKEARQLKLVRNNNHRSPRKSPKGKKSKNLPSR